MDLSKLVAAVLLFAGGALVETGVAQTASLASPGPGVFIVTSDASAPVALYRVDPEYTEAAYQAKYSGTVVLRSVIDPTGAARDICVIRSLGLGLDENLLESKGS